MADGIPPAAAPGMEDPPGKEPPLLDTIRLKGPQAKGLNKRAILITAGAGVGAVLVMASGAFSSNPSHGPAETKPIMSDPARPEMAEGAIRSLPATYTEAAARAPAPVAVEPPQLGPPLPGDIAAFAEADPSRSTPSPESAYTWSATDPAPPMTPALSEEEKEEKDAERSVLFFALREEPRQPAPAADAKLRDPRMQAPQGASSDSGLASTSGDSALFPGAVIPASLVTELNSESPGPVIAQVTQSIYDSATGRTLLIPQGAKLIGDYKSSSRYGQSRVAITWARLIMPDGTERVLDEAAVSPNGAAGISGDVDNHWGDVFGAAILGTLINVGVATTEDPQITFAGIGGVSRDPVDRAIQDGVQRSASTVTNRVVDRGLAIPPTIRLQAGARISVIVTRRSTF